MSPTEKASPTPAQNSQEATPASNDNTDEGGRAPDGRNDGNTVTQEQNVNKTEETNEKDLTEQNETKPENSVDLGEIKQSDVTKTEDTNNEETVDSKQEPQTVDADTNTERDKTKVDSSVDTQSKGTAKVTEYKTMTSIERNDGRAEEDDPGHVVDIVKQSKLRESMKKSTSELGDFPEFPMSRPLTETSFRDGATKMSFDTEREKRDSRMDTERGESKTPFSVSIGRKPLHTAISRSHSDYYSKSPGTSRFTYIAASFNNYHGFQPDLKAHQQQQRMRRPPKLVRLATVTMSPKTKPQPRGPSLYYEDPKKPIKVISWDEATDARPPLRIDMEGPGPTSYTPRVKPLNETNSPAWSFGSKCAPEKAGGSRTSWEKTWFQNPDVWTSKVDFYNDSAWPTPLHYRHRPSLGPRQKTMPEPPSFTIGTRKEMSINKRGSDKEPSPADYDKDMADKVILTKAPAFSHQFRREGTVMWNGKAKVPGPGAYSPKYSYNKPHGPAFTIRNMRREKSHFLGPFSTF